MMNTVSIVPVDTEIRRRWLQMRKALYCLFRIGIALRIGVFRNTPDTFYCRIILHKFLHHIHIRSFRGHGDVDHLDTEEFRDTEMTIISRHGAKEFYLVQFTPGGIAANAMGHRASHRVEHNVQTGVAIDDDLIRFHLAHSAKQTFRLRNTIQYAVVTTVYTGLTPQIRTCVKHVHHLHRDIKLIHRRLSSGHIQ